MDQRKGPRPEVEVQIPEIIPDGLSLCEAEPLLRDVAVALADHRDFGDSEYEEGLRVLLRSLDEDADLSPVGRQSVAGMVLTALLGRLLSEKAFARDAKEDERVLRAPIVIVGLPRTGTTALQGLLCTDPANQGLELWLAQSPEPRPPRAQWADAIGYRRCVTMLEQMPAAMRDIHPMEADAPDECWHLLRQSFASVTFECAARVSSYSQWWAEHDMRPAYRRWARNLRLIGRNDPGRVWILKDPSHLFAPDALLDVAPDATIVMTHRDPARSIPSVASLTSFPRALNDRRPEPARLGPEQEALWARGVTRMMSARERHPGNFVDIAFQDLHRDPIDVVRRIYAHMGRDLGSEAERVGRSWLAANRAHPHSYAPEQFGLEADSIRERFKDYIETFSVPLEE